MAKRLVITEKPSVARDIAAALGGFEDHEDYLENEQFVVTFAIGHLLELAEPQDYDKKFSSWSVKNLPIIPEGYRIQPKEGQKQRLAMIAKLGKRKDIEGIIDACDAGREGELIFRRIVEYCELESLPQERLWLQSMTKDAIRTAFRELKPGREFDRLADAAFLRAVGDWLVGMNATRALTQRLKSRGETDSWSAGRVQTPTLDILVERERKILAHVPRPYWEITGKFEHKGQQWEAKFWDPESKAAAIKDKEDEDEAADAEAKPNRIFDRSRVDRLMDALIKQKHGEAGEKRKKSKQNPPLPFDLTSLQREANRKFGYSAKRTLDAAQRLYEAHKALTYPRTDSRHLPKDYAPTVTAVLMSLQRIPELHDLAQEIGRAPQNLDKILDDTKISDHFAIVPTGTLPEGGLRGDDERIFDLVVRQFMASLMGPATWSQVERIVTVPAGEEQAKFRATSRTLEEPGYYRAIGIPTEAHPLPPLIPGQDTAAGVKADILEITEEAKDTKPPPRYSEATLLRMMETAGEALTDDELSDAMRGRGLGTPATRADTIEGLVRKSYARRVDGKLGPTSKGMRLMDILSRLSVGALRSPKMTGEWEHQLQLVQSGKLKRKELLEKLETFTRDMTGSIVTFDHMTLFADQPDLGVCPACGIGKVVETAWGYRCTRNTREDKNATPDCDFIVWKDRAGRFVDRDLVRRLIADRKVAHVTGFVDRSGRTLEGSLSLERDPEKDNRWALRIEYGQSTGQADKGPEVAGVAIAPCPIHENCDIVETNRRFVCKTFLAGEMRGGPQLPKQVCQREVTAEEAMQFYGPEGKTEILEGWISRFGKPFRGALKRNEKGRYEFEFPERPDRPARAPKAGAEAKGAKGKKGRGKGAVEAPAEGVEVAEAKAATGKGGKAKAAPKAAKAGKAVKAKGATGGKAGKAAKGKGATGGKAGKASSAKAATGKAETKAAPKPAGTVSKREAKGKGGGGAAVGT